MAERAPTQRNIDVLARLVLLGYTDTFDTVNPDSHAIDGDLEYVSRLDETGRAEFLGLADMHHVTVRALKVVAESPIASEVPAVKMWVESSLLKERQRIDNAVKSLAPVCEALDAAGANVVVIKSLDHLPDLGSDLDLYTTGTRDKVIEVMTKKFGAALESRSWGDRLANKWNFNIPGLAELIEVHVRYLGQTGEHKVLAKRVMDRSVIKGVNGYSFRVPAPEERVIISTLQRMYRHLYFRLCDMCDFAMLLQNRSIDFVELRNAATNSGIWPGVATFLLLISEFVKSMGGNVPVPPEVLASANSQVPVYLGGNFLRVSKSSAIGLFGSQLLSAGRHVDLRAMARLPLLPPLAISALLAYKLTGSDKGVW